MAASRTIADTVPGELQRQSSRVEEQLTRLNAILDIITNRLEDMSQMMSNYSPELVTQINNLKASLDTYKTKASNIYGEIADSLLRYATNLLQNLENLTSSVTAIGESVRDL